jgi:N-acetyl-gamma-glutamyl-phosphate reductase
MLRAAIVGGTGYTGGELARLLCRHPHVQIVAMTSRQQNGVKVNKVHPFLQGFVDISFSDKVVNDPDVVFLATPHGASMEAVPPLVESGVKVIDLSGDYRLKDAQVYQKWYGEEHKDLANLPKAVYGMSELFDKEIAKATLLSNPGCYPTCSTLSLAPLFAAKVIDDHVIVDAKSGTSGAGAEPTKATHHPNCAASINPYKVVGHRHTPEIQMALERVAKSNVEVVFTPHLIPVVRGMLTTSYVHLNQELSKEEVLDLYRQFYHGRKFIRLTSIPSMQSVAGSNFIEIGVEKAVGRNLVVMGALDNLVKGAAGQAIQNCNIMHGLPESEGLDFPGLGV